MAGFDKATQRVIAVIALMILAAWSLRGYVPGAAERSVERGPPQNNPAALAAVVAMLTAAVAIIGFAIIVRLRDRRPRPPSARALPRSPGAMGRPTWRFSVIALAAITAWLLLIVVLSRVTGPEPIQPPPGADPAAPGATSPPARLPDEADGDSGGSGGSGVVEYLVPPMLVLMGLVMLGTAIAARRQRRGAQPDAGADEYVAAAAPKATNSLVRAAEIGLAEIGDLSREPREAIIACYAAMERELTRVPGAVPQDCDTPTEVLARAVDRHALPAHSATELVELFEEARFSPHVMTEEHRDAAVRVLHRVLAELAERVPEVQP